jgi:hypothetical protein
MALMARQLRVEYPGAIYHLMGRGDRKKDIYPGRFEVERRGLTEPGRSGQAGDGGAAAARGHFDHPADSPTAWEVGKASTTSFTWAAKLRSPENNENLWSDPLSGTPQRQAKIAREQKIKNCLQLFPKFLPAPK